MDDIVNTSFLSLYTFTSTWKYIQWTLPINSELGSWVTGPEQHCINLTENSPTEIASFYRQLVVLGPSLPICFFSFGDSLIRHKNPLQNTMMHLVNCSGYLKCLVHTDLQVISPSSHRQKSLVDYHKFKLQVQIKIKLMRHLNVIEFIHLTSYSSLVFMFTFGKM